MVGQKRCDKHGNAKDPKVLILHNRMTVQQTSATKKAQHYVPGHHERLEEELCLFGALQEGLVVFFAETVDLH